MKNRIDELSSSSRSWLTIKAVCDIFQPCFEPQCSLEIEVVGPARPAAGIRLREQSRRKRHPHAPAAGELAMAGRDRRWRNEPVEISAARDGAPSASMR